MAERAGQGQRQRQGTQTALEPPKVVMAQFTLRFYADIERHNETPPCRLHARTYPSLGAAEAAAMFLMPEVKQEHGDKSGYAISDETGWTVEIGPRRDVEAK